MVNRKKKSAPWSKQRILKHLQKGNPSRSEHNLEYAIRSCQAKPFKRVGSMRFYDEATVKIIVREMIEIESRRMGRPREARKVVADAGR